MWTEREVIDAVNIKGLYAHAHTHTQMKGSRGKDSRVGSTVLRVENSLSAVLTCSHVAAHTK